MTSFHIALCCCILLRVILRGFVFLLEFARGVFFAYVVRCCYMFCCLKIQQHGQRKANSNKKITTSGKLEGMRQTRKHIELDVCRIHSMLLDVANLFCCLSLLYVGNVALFSDIVFYMALCCSLLRFLFWLSVVEIA